jgi:hypothetical protein
MARRKRRIDRKLHRWFLELGVIDASQDSGWRRRLFAAPLHQPFPIDAGHTDGLPAAATRGVRRYGLSYTVCRVAQAQTPFAEPDWEGCVFFRFQASRYPDIVNFTANNLRSCGGTARQGPE